MNTDVIYPAIQSLKIMPSSEHESRGTIDKNRLARAVKLSEKKSAFDFAWGDEVSGIEKLIKTLHVEAAGNVPIPVSIEVSINISS